MAAQVISGLGIDTAFPTGQLSLHDYRKLLSQQDDALSPPPSRMLKRKQAAVNLYQAQSQYHNEFAASFHQLQSPVSSAPSSPPPLSFSQSVISLHGDLPTPISPASINRPFSQPLSASGTVSRRMDTFSARLKKPKQLPPTPHSRSSSQLTLPSTGGGGVGSPPTKLHHNGTDFEILNPKDSFLHFLSDSIRYRISIHSSNTNNMEVDREDSPDDISPSLSFMSDIIPDEMVRPISASESAVLSRYQRRGPESELAGMPRPQQSFGALPALPALSESPPDPVVHNPGPSRKSVGKTLKEKMSRLLNSSDISSGSSSDRRFFHKCEDERQHVLDDQQQQRENVQDDDDDEFHTPPPGEFQWQDEMPATPVRSQPAGRLMELDYEEPPSPSPRVLDGEVRALRRRTGPHMSNRHHTLQDALRQLEAENNGLTYQDILQYLGPEAAQELTSAGHQYEEEQEEDGDDDDDEEEGLIERPWQPDTWQERPRVFHVPHNLNRPSDSNLSTNAPSTRASIRPYVEQARAFMAGDGNASLASSDSTAANDEGEYYYNDEEDDDDDDADAKYADRGKHASLASTQSDGVHEMAPITPIRRTISRRARPLSSNPPDLDTPIISASPPPPSITGVSSPPVSPTTSRRATRISWSPEIPARHPDHRFVRFEQRQHQQQDGPGPTRMASPPPPPVPPRVVTTVISRKRKEKRHGE